MGAEVAGEQQKIIVYGGDISNRHRRIALANIWK